MRLVDTRQMANLDTPAFTFNEEGQGWDAHFPSFKLNGHDDWVGFGPTKEAAAKALQGLVDDLGGPMAWRDS